MAEDMTITELKAERIKLEESIRDLLLEFTMKSGVVITALKFHSNGMDAKDIYYTVYTEITLD